MMTSKREDARERGASQSRRTQQPYGRFMDDKTTTATH